MMTGHRDLQCDSLRCHQQFFYMTPVISVSRDYEAKVHSRVNNMKRILILILILAMTALAAARDKKSKAQPGPYIFTSKASTQTLKVLIVQANLREGYALDSEDQFQFRFSKPAQMPVMGALFMASSACPGMTTKKVWSYTLAELNGMTKVTVMPVWEYPDDYCKTQTQELIWSQREEIAAFQAMLDKAPTSSAQVPTPAPTSVADQQQDTKRHTACLELAKDNPSITCK
jgi:hypothetical protein